MNSKTKRSSAEPDAVSPHKWAMVIDMQKCVGCEDCTLACRANNDVPPDMSWNRIIEVEQLGERTIYATIPCMQCEHAPCVGVCPVGATYHRADGIVMMDYDKCIGCRYCQMACSYGARSFNWKQFTSENPSVPEYGTPEVERRPRGVVEKCSFCYQRIDRGLEMGYMPGIDREATPSCVNACPVGARLFGDLNDLESPVSKVLATHTAVRLREASGTEPRVYYLPAHEEEMEVSA
ncbi:MAG: 4Fe-4S dicluster domain-containing protein [Chloroflexi bacterium]|nr:4Fe-4S dicluster domain-containing protein [Chloroflexota bacterium]